MNYPIPSRVPLPTRRPQQQPMMAQPPMMAQQAPQPGGNRFMQGLGQNSEILLALGAGLLGGRTGPEQWSGGLGAMAQSMGAAKEKKDEAAKKNKTLDWLRQNAPEYADAVEQGALSVGDAYKMKLEAQKPKQFDPTDDIREYEFARSQGFNGSFQDFMTEMKRAGATNITVGDGAPGLGKLSTDYGYKLGPDQKPVIGPDGLPIAAPIPGSPAARDIESGRQKEMLQQSSRDVSTQTVTTAAGRAREAARNRALGPVGQSIVGAVNPYSDSAEVQRQVEVLKSNAKIENLTAMRAASPTGGALGAVSDKESEMLAAKSGALDPSSPTFERDLNDYELTLLQIVHGFEAGTQIYNATRSGSVPIGQESDSGVGSLLDKYDPQR